MKIALPRTERNRSRKLVRVIPDGQADLDRIAGMPFPYMHEDDDSYLVHVSTVERLMRRGWINGATPEARDLLKRYCEEIKLTFIAKDCIDDESAVAEWSRHLDPKHYKVLPYQIAGMERLYTRFTQWGTGVILGDDVGLGKTVQTIGLIGRLKAEGKLRRAIITTTSGMKTQWSDEIANFSMPKLKVATADGPKSWRVEKLNSKADIYIVNHEMFRFPHYKSLIERVVSKGVDLIVVDESSYLKNHETVTHKAVFDTVQHVRWSLLLNATVVENSLHDFYAQVRLCDRRLLGTYPGFDRRYVKRTVDKRVVGYKQLREFRKRTALVMYRRTRSQVKLQLPQVVSQARRVEMGKRQADEYRRYVGDAITERGSGAIKLAKLAKVQMAAYAASDGQSAKMDDLIELLSGELAGERVVVFTRFKEIAKDAVLRLKDFSPAIITGDTKHRERNDTRRRFASKYGVGTVLVGTEAMSRGLNLQTAGVVVNLDLPWNPAQLRQRIGRVNRVGQERCNILVINYIATHPSGHPTIDDYMVEKIVPKRELFREVVGDDDVDELGNESVNPDAVMDYISAVAR